ncbi:dual specificity protein kinase shkB-like [Oculina patagonica]
MLMADQLLGTGAWGRVVRGKFRRCNVAVKQIYETLLSPHTRTILEREVGIASRCRHPCLLQFIGATRDAMPLIVTELMDRSLRSLYGERPLTEREISFISLDVAQALNYLHQNKPDPIIHRDISSANILLWRQGQQWRGKVSDYGTANFVRQCTRDDPGAPIYCAPEAISEAQDHIISCKVDV